MNEKKFVAAVEKQLELFRTATEWSDLVTYLTGLESILRMYIFKQIPFPDLFYRRLSQCLNPALPAGVHIKSLNVYRLLISKLSSKYLSENVEVLCLGLFSFYSHASLSTIPVYIETIAEIVERLKEKNWKICRQIVSSVIMGLEEENGEAHSGAQRVLSALEKAVGKQHVIQAVMEIVEQRIELVPGCIAYLSKIPKEERERVGKEFSRALECKEIVTVRRAFDMLILWREEGTEINEEEVTISILQLLLQKEISLQKRVQQWISILLEKKGEDILFSILCEVHRRDASLYFKILLSLHQCLEDSHSFFIKSVAYALNIEEALPEANGFFKAVNRRIVWSALIEEEEKVIEKAISIGLLDEVAEREELSLIVQRRIEEGSPPLSWIRKIYPSPSRYISICEASFKYLRSSEIEEAVKVAIALMKMRKRMQTYMEQEDLKVFDKNSKKGKENNWKSFLVDLVCKAWESPNLSVEMHHALIQVLELGKIFGDLWINEWAQREKEIQNVAEILLRHPNLFWAYNEKLGEILPEAVLMRLFEKEENQKEESVRIFERVFSLIEQAPESIWVNRKLLEYLLSFSETNNHRIKKRFIKFIQRITCYKEIWNILLSLLNRRRERVEESKKMRIINSDQNRILYSLRIIHLLLKHNSGFLSAIHEGIWFQRKEEDEYYDLLLYVFKTPEDTPFHLLFSLLIIQLCGEHHKYSIIGLEDKREEIVQKALESSLFLMQNRVKVQVHPYIVDSLLNQMDLGTLSQIMDLSLYLGVDLFYSVIIGVYTEKEEIREDLVYFVLLNEMHALSLSLLEVSMQMLQEGQLQEIGRIEKIISQRINIHENELHVVSSPLMIQKKTISARASPWKEKELTWIIQQMLSLYESLMKRINKTSPSEETCEYKEENFVMKSIRRKLCQLYKKYPEVFSESIIIKSREHEIFYLDSIDPLIRCKLFTSLLRLLHNHPVEKWTLLRKWLVFFCSTKDLETQDVFNTLTTLLIQAKNKLEHIEMLFFIAKFITISSVPETKELGILVLEVCSITANRNGMKRINELGNENEKLSLFLNLLQISNQVAFLLLSRDFLVDISNIWSFLVFPCYKLSPSSSLFLAALDFTETIALLKDTKIWKKEFYEYLLTDRFFKDSLENMKKKIIITSQFIDPDRVTDLISRTNNSGFFIRDSDVTSRIFLLKRIRFMVLSAPFGEYLQEISQILGMISEIFSGSPGSKGFPGLLVEAYALCRVLSVKMPSSSLINMWPIVISESISAIRSITTYKDRLIPFSALRFLDTVSCLDYEETMEFRWLLEGLEEEPTESSASLRSPCIIKSSEWPLDNLPEILKKVAIHHRVQRHCTKMDDSLVFLSLIDELPEPIST
ncbi:hypothetical protein NEFER03_2219 [Nematocida sp. LUAm3]|nr:hypothetical protein NEFER03_2219 [Nematocida sp. LUAm3]KAI5176353.1 hypothetical protein NEFER02_2131 [Nematocida sp. LUAm2]KAI5179373.1 hypothetical protein NEFER01_2209 [Nematocida sp. LUAm1]